jgi:surface protein
MFEACIALVEIIGIENLDVSNASKYSFSEMFHCCKSLKKLDLSLWDTSRADNFARMFGNCEKLETVNISGFKIDNLEYVTEMFYNDISLVEIIGIDELDFSDISDFDTMYNGTNIFFEA